MAGRCEFHDALDAGFLGGEPEQTVVGSDEARAGASLDGNRRARGADAGIDHCEEDGARRKIAPGFAQGDRAGDNALCNDSVSDVDHVGSGSNRRDHALHRTDIVIAIAEVGYNGDRKGVSFANKRRHRRQLIAKQRLRAISPKAIHRAPSIESMNSRSSYWRAQSSALLLIAVAVGTLLRFFGLGSRELSIDESLSWAEASRRNVDRILHVQHRLDSGKFPIYEIAQHEWMSLFGDSEAAMRALPALIGSLSIVLVFILGVELMLAVSETSEAPAAGPGALSGRSAEPSPDLSGENNGRGSRHQSMYIVAGLCALLFAVGLPSVEIARQARMYSMMQGWVLAQVIFLLRARRLGGPANYAGLTIFSAIAVATNFTAGLVIAAEAVWLIYLYFADTRSDAGARSAAPWLMAGALIG